MKPGTEKKRASLSHSAVVAVFLFGFIWGILSFFFENSAMANPDPVVVQVRATANVEGNDIYLRDVADISAPVMLKEKLGAIHLGPSPRPGKEKKILSRRLISMVQAAKVMPEDAKLTVPESIKIDRVYQTLQEEALQQLYERSVRDVLGGADFKVRRVKVSGTNQFPMGKLTLSVLKSGNQEMTGNVNLRVQVQVNDENCGRLTLAGWVDRFAPVVCVSREVARQAILTEKDLTLKTVNISTLSGELIAEMANVVGKQTRMSLRVGTCLRSGMLAVPPLVQKGDRVKILAGSGKVKVSTVGIAKGSGGKGDQIRVENIVSNKIVVGRVTGEGIVEVMF